MTITEFNGGGGNGVAPSCKVKKGTKINICYSSDKNYAKYLALSIATVLTSKNPEDDLCFYILDGGITEKDKEKILNLKSIAPFEIQFIKMDDEVFKKWPLRSSTYYTTAIYYRLLIPDLLSSLERIIYLDCDIEVKHSLKELYNMELSGCCIGLVKDIDEDIHIKRLNLEKYFNSGVLVMDLAKLREINFTGKVFDFIEQHKDKLVYYDQDVLNLYFKDAIKTIDDKWNNQFDFFARNANKRFKDAFVIHYIGSEKRNFVLYTLPLCFKTDYKLEFLKLYIGRVCKFVVQWLFRVRNKDKFTKQITILGMDFYCPRKKHNK